MYLVRDTRTSGFNSISQVEDVTASYAQKHRTKKIHRSAIGNIQEVEATGPNRGYFHLSLTNAVQGTGQKRSFAGNPMVEARQASFQKVVREITEDDLAALAEIDQRVEEAREALSAVRKEREQFIREEAWKRARRVSIGVFHAQANEREEKRTYPDH